MLNQTILDFYAWHTTEGVERRLSPGAIAHITRSRPDSRERSHADITQNVPCSLGQHLVRISNQVDEARHGLSTSIHQHNLRATLPLCYTQSREEAVQGAITLNTVLLYQTHERLRDAF